MNKNTKYAFAAATLASFCMAAIPAVPALADSVDVKGYLVLGEDLNRDQTKIVLKNLGIEDEDDYNVSYTTNEEEHEAFDAYLSKSVIGTKAYSSILLVPADKGDGITIKTSNINYCTEEMYQNALISAGVEDVDVYITAPTEVSGTCALVGAMNAYEIMTGEALSDDAADTAADELVTTGDIADQIGDKDQAAELIAALKQKVAGQDDITEDQLSDIVDDTCDEMGLSLDDQLKTELIKLLKKLNALNIDEDTLKKQASGLYDSIQGLLSDSGITQEEAGNFLTRLFDAIASFFRNLFTGSDQ